MANRTSYLRILLARCWLLSLLILPAVLFHGTAHAQEALSDPLAISLKAQGDEAMQSLRYQDALDAYERATEIEPHPVLLFNRGRALQALHRYAEALAHFEAFERQASPDLRAKAGKLDELMERLRDQIATLNIQCNVRGATVLVRGQKVGETPIEHPVRVNAGEANLTVLANGYRKYSVPLELEGRSTQRLEVRLQPIDDRGTLIVNSPISGATARVDGRFLGTVPAEIALPRGSHRVAVEHPDYQTTSTTVELHSGERRHVNVNLEAKPGLLSKWWFWAGAGVLVAGGVTLAVVLSTEKDNSSGDIPPGVISAPLTF